MTKRTIQHDAVQERDFFTDVMDVVRHVPKGRVTSYGAIAKYIGAARSSRMVGYCMNNSHTVRPSVPAHRVVNRNGILSGKHHFPGPDSMSDRLAKEGVLVVDDRVQGFEECFWDPSIELKV